MNYIVLDLEWNQSDTGNEPTTKEIPFEIIDIGAVKLNSDRIMTDEFNQLIKPSVYHHMHKVTGKLIHLHMRDLKRGVPLRRWQRVSFLLRNRFYFLHLGAAGLV